MIRILQEYFLEESAFTDAVDKFSSEENEKTAQLYVDKFRKLKDNSRIKDDKQKDIQFWVKQGFNEFKKFVDSFDNQKSNTQVKKDIKVTGSELVYEDDFWSIYWIKTAEASKQLGKGTTWCISGDSTRTHYNGAQYFNDYKTKCSMYFMISKTMEYHPDDKNNPENAYYKVAAVRYDKNKNNLLQFWNADDNNVPKSKIDNFPNYDFPDMVEELKEIEYKILKQSIPEFTIEDGILRKYNWDEDKAVIPNSVTKIGMSAFAETNLTSVTIPNSVTKIGSYAFYGNELASVTIPNSVTEIGLDAFYDNNLTSVTIPNSITYIGSYAFAYNKLTSVTIPNGATDIGKNAFYNNKLTSVTIPNSVTKIGSYAFSGNKLTSINIPDSVTYIGSYAFYGNELASVTIPNSVTEIGSYAFYNNKLTSVTIPEKFENMIGYIFGNLSKYCKIIYT